MVDLPERKGNRQLKARIVVLNLVVVFYRLLKERNCIFCGWPNFSQSDYRSFCEQLILFFPSHKSDEIRHELFCFRPHLTNDLENVRIHPTLLQGSQENGKNLFLLMISFPERPCGSHTSSFGCRSKSRHCRL